MPGLMSIARRILVLYGLLSLAATFFFGQPFISDLRPKSAWVANFYRNVPYTATWGSWWHPHRPTTNLKDIIDSDWNLLYHLGGYGPWVQRGNADGIAPPAGCTVEQIHMMSRHAERYPTKKAGRRMLATFDSLKQSGLVYKGDLAFVNGWNFFSSDPSTEFEQLTTTGPYAGSLQAFTAGLKLRTRYRHLIPKNKTKFWASDSKRVIESGKYFAAGFFGLPWEDHSTLDVIPETPELGGDTLTPGDTCLKYALDTEEGHDYGNNVLMKFRPIYIQYIRQRLMIQNPSSEFTDTEIWSMQEMCGFETIIRGSSNWCDVFTRKEWEAFEYARDLVHYYRGGPGNKYGKAMGWLWLNATRNLLLKGPTAGPLFFSFVHDGDIAPMLAALGLFQQEDHLSVDGHIPQGRKWKTSEIFPMGARIIFERLSCKAEDKKSESQDFVRINVNDGIVAMPTCHNGPGGSCPLGEFSKFVDARGVVAQDFRQICGLGPDAAAKITFLHQ